jgi:transposase
MSNANQSAERESFWRDVLTRFGTSGLSVRAFCLAGGFGKSSFYAWRRVLAEGDAATSQPAFLPVTVRPEPASSSSALSLELRDGRVLRFGDALPAERIAAVIHALESAEVRS